MIVVFQKVNSRKFKIKLVKFGFAFEVTSRPEIPTLEVEIKFKYTMSLLGNQYNRVQFMQHDENPLLKRCH
ncbi:unnamed protein product [Allacma fusca]|uniref:Uncharacterized protein n=1 Tax=Allacma fusca TaxID=39272 RepID=A0A8J2JNZ7_9HEXA|nr:unnamed protein product [Allacma fusca]